jgi:hypothetical protein
MWSGISGLITLAVMVFNLWLKNENAKEEKFNADKKAIQDSVASGDHSRINAIVQQLRR